MKMIENLGDLSFLEDLPHDDLVILLGVDLREFFSIPQSRGATETYLTGCGSGAGIPNTEDFSISVTSMIGTI